jgi:hypothetical protein
MASANGGIQIAVPTTSVTGLECVDPDWRNVMSVLKQEDGEIDGFWTQQITAQYNAEALHAGQVLARRSNRIVCTVAAVANRLEESLIRMEE